MALGHSPKIVTQDLALYLDAANKKSYPGSGNTWFDLSGKNNNATRTFNTLYGSEVQFNSSGYFDYTGNSPATSNNALEGNGFEFSSIIMPTTGSFSVSAWIKRDTTIKPMGDRETIFSCAGGADGWRFGVQTAGNLYYLVGTSASFQEGAIGSNTTLINGNWHMASIVYDRAAVFGTCAVYGYIDDKQIGSVTIAAGLAANKPFPSFNIPGIGYRGCCDVFAGLISSVTAYSRALTAAEVKQNFNALRGRYGL